MTDRVRDDHICHRHGHLLVTAIPVADFVCDRPTFIMLALSFLFLVGIALIADGFHFHVPRGYLYFAIFFPGWLRRSTCGPPKPASAGST